MSSTKLHFTNFKDNLNGSCVPSEVAGEILNEDMIPVLSRNLESNEDRKNDNQSVDSVERAMTPRKIVANLFDKMALNYENHESGNMLFLDDSKTSNEVVPYTLFSTEDCEGKHDIIYNDMNNIFREEGMKTFDNMMVDTLVVSEPAKPSFETNDTDFTANLMDFKHMNEVDIVDDFDKLLNSEILHGADEDNKEAFTDFLIESDNSQDKFHGNLYSEKHEQPIKIEEKDPDFYPGDSLETPSKRRKIPKTPHRFARRRRSLIKTNRSAPCVPKSYFEPDELFEFVSEDLIDVTDTTKSRTRRISSRKLKKETNNTNNEKTSKKRSKKCNVEGCTKNARGNTGFCVRHGGGRRCEVEGCNKSARSFSQFCSGHGGGRRCVVEGCTKGALSKTDYCRKHGKDIASQSKLQIQ